MVRTLHRCKCLDKKKQDMCKERIAKQIEINRILSEQKGEQLRLQQEYTKKKRFYQVANGNYGLQMANRRPVTKGTSKSRAYGGRAVPEKRRDLEIMKTKIEKEKCMHEERCCAQREREKVMVEQRHKDFELRREMNIRALGEGDDFAHGNRPNKRFEVPEKIKNPNKKKQTIFVFTSPYDEIGTEYDDVDVEEEEKKVKGKEKDEENVKVDDVVEDENGVKDKEKVDDVDVVVEETI